MIFASTLWNIKIDVQILDAFLHIICYNLMGRDGPEPIISTLRVAGLTIW